MLKRIIVLFVVVCMLLPSVAMANDGGPRYDHRYYLTIKVKPKQERIEIGGSLELEITLINNTPHPIKRIGFIHVLNDLEDYFNDDYTYDWGDFDGIIQAGEKIILDVVIPVTNRVDWYYKDDKYYVDLDLRMIYFAVPHEKSMKTFRDGTWDFISKPIKSIPLEITDIKDGSKYLDLNVMEKETIFCFYKRTDDASFEYDGEFKASIENRVTIMSKTKDELTDIYLRASDKYFFSEYDISLGENNTASEIFHVSYYIKPEAIRKKLPVTYKVIFNVGGEYYCVFKECEYPTKILCKPKLDIKIKEMEEIHRPNGKDLYHCIAIVRNISSEDYHNFFLSYEAIYDSDYKPSKVYPEFKSGENIEVSFVHGFKSDDFDKSVYVYDGDVFKCGYIIENNMYTWRIWGDDLFSSWQETGAMNDGKKSMITPTLTPTPTPWKIVIPPSKGTPQPTPLASKDTTITPSIETPMLDVTVKHVEKRSSLPVWVLVALGLTVMGAIALVITLRRRSTKEQSN